MRWLLALLLAATSIHAADVTVFRDGVGDAGIEDLPLIIFSDGVAEGLPDAGAAADTNIPEYASTIIWHAMDSAATETNNLAALSSAPSINIGTSYRAPPGNIGVIAGRPHWGNTTDRWAVSNEVRDAIADTTVWTLSFWGTINTDNNQDNNAFTIARDADATDTRFSISLDYRSANDRVRILGRDGGVTQVEIRSPDNSLDDLVATPNHYVVVHDGTYPQIYINGSAVAQTTSTATDVSFSFEGVLTDAASPADNVAIGAMRANGTTSLGWSNGELDDFILWDGVALSAAQVLALAEMQKYQLAGQDSSGQGWSEADEDDTNATSLALSYNMSSEGDAGTVIKDTSGNNNNGTVNDATFATALTNGYYSFDGVNDDIETVSTSVGGDMTSMTVSMWAQPTTGSSDDGMLANRSSGDTAKIGYNASGDSFVLVITEGGTASINDPYTLTNGAWCNIAFTWDGSSGDIIVYYNGLPVSTNLSTSATGTFNVDDQWYVGSDERLANRYFAGLADEVRVYSNKVATASEILFNFNQTKSYHP